MSPARTTDPNDAWIPALVLVACLAVGAVAGVLGQRRFDRAADTHLLVTGAYAASHYSRLLLARVRALENVALLDAQVSDAPAREALRAGFVDVLGTRHPEFAWVGFVDAAGRIGRSVRGLRSGADASVRDDWRAGLRGPYLGDVHRAVRPTAAAGRGRDGEAPGVLDVAVPLRRGDAAPYGVLAAQVDARWVTEIRDELTAIVAPLGGIELRVLLRDGTTDSGSRFEPDQGLPDRIDPGGIRLTGRVDGVPRTVSVHPVAGDVVVERLGWRILVVRDPGAHHDLGRRALAEALAIGTGIGLLAAVAVAALQRGRRLRWPRGP